MTMTVRVSYTVDVDDGYCRAINHELNRSGGASRKQVKEWFRANGEALDNMRTKHAACCWGAQPETEKEE